MATTASSNDSDSTLRRKRTIRFLTIKFTLLTLLGVGLGIAHDRASRHSYGPDYKAGFHTGVLHGALMPAALPTLLMGNDLPIYASNNIGRGYNIGFILGINGCGTLFFGIGFLRPRKQ